MSERKKCCNKIEGNQWRIFPNQPLLKWEICSFDGPCLAPTTSLPKVGMYRRTKQTWPCPTGLQCRAGGCYTQHASKSGITPEGKEGTTRRLL